MSILRAVALTVALVATFAIGSLTVAPVEAAPQKANVGQLVSGLINVNVGAVQVAIEDNNIQLVNVEDVLNDANIEILNNVLNNSPILSNNSNFLNNLLQNADILTENQVVVGVLSGGQIVFQNV